MKGRQLHSPDTSKTRPTTDKLRSSIFSILGDLSEYPDILDGFAGTGALGIESYSRGSSSVDFIDLDKSSIEINTKLMDLGSFRVFKGDYFKILPTLNKQYDLIFIDPPYNQFPTSEILQPIIDNNLLKYRGIILYEEFYKTDFISINDLSIIDERKYGDTIIRFLRKTSEID